MRGHFVQQCTIIVCVLLSCSVLAAWAASSELPPDSSAHAAPTPAPTPAPPRTVLADDTLARGSEDLPLDHPRIRKAVQGCEQAEQVHLTFWSSTAVLVSWATCDALLGPAAAARGPAPTRDVRSAVHFGTSPGRLERAAEGGATSYVHDFGALGYGTSYASPLLHHVLLTGLTPGVRYFYRLASSDAGQAGRDGPPPKPAATAKLYDFTLPKPHTFPVRVGVLGDPGQTYNTTATLDRLIANRPALVLLTGDLAYADNFLDASTFVGKGQYGAVTYDGKWDTWGRLFEPLLSHVPLIHTDGNHELPPLTARHKAYNHRFPTPYLSGHDTSRGPAGFAPASPGGDPFANLFYAVELHGVAKFISLTSYAPGQTFAHDEPQYVWLKRELEQTDRTATPWLVVAVHAPWYHTYKGHYKEAECIRQAYEPLLVAHGVDLVLHGHVHAYERTSPLDNYTVSCGGPTYITIGDAGNVEGLYQEFIDQPSLASLSSPAAAAAAASAAAAGPGGGGQQRQRQQQRQQPAFCADPTDPANSARLFSPLYQPQACYSWQDGAFCPAAQPAWSAYREPSFGHGMLEIESPTRARWLWYKNQAPAWEVADEVLLLRGSERGCGGQRSAAASDAGAAAPVEASSQASSQDGDVAAAEASAGFAAKVEI